jgi:hypothetical protein
VALQPFSSHAERVGGLKPARFSYPTVEDACAPGTFIPTVYIHRQCKMSTKHQRSGTPVVSCAVVPDLPRNGWIA